MHVSMWALQFAEKLDLYQGIALAMPQVVQNSLPLQGLRIGFRIFQQTV
jgi:hypothetical protein